MKSFNIFFLLIFSINSQSVRNWIYIESNSDAGDRGIKINYYHDIENCEGKNGAEFFSDSWHDTVLTSLEQISNNQIIDPGNNINRSNVSSLRLGLKFNGEEKYTYIDFKNHVFISGESAHSKKLKLLQSCFEINKEAHTFVSIWTGNFPEDSLLRQAQAICTLKTSEYHGFQPIYEKENPTFTLDVWEMINPEEIGRFMDLQMREIRDAQKYYAPDYSFEDLFNYRVVSLYDKKDNETFRGKITFCAESTDQSTQTNYKKVKESHFPLNHFLGEGLYHTVVHSEQLALKYLNFLAHEMEFVESLDTTTSDVESLENFILGKTSSRNNPKVDRRLFGIRSHTHLKLMETMREMGDIFRHQLYYREAIKSLLQAHSDLNKIMFASDIVPESLINNIREKSEIKAHKIVAFTDEKRMSVISKIINRAIRKILPCSLSFEVSTHQKMCPLCLESHITGLFSEQSPIKGYIARIFLKNLSKKVNDSNFPEFIKVLIKRKVDTGNPRESLELIDLLSKNINPIFITTSNLNGEI